MISVIVPVYNVEKYLYRCIGSILNQTFKDLEIILIDDGSKDRSGIICDEFKKKDNRIKVIHKKNEGLGLARNTGMDIATGDYITFVDSDDYISTTLVEDLYKGIVSNNVDTALGGFKKITNDDKILLEKIPEFNSYSEKNVLEEFLPKLIGSSPEKSDSIKMSVWNGMYSRDIISKNKIKFPSEREFISEDIIFALEYYRFSKGVCILNNSNYYYRVNQNSLTKSYRKDRFEASKKIYQKELEMIRELDIYEKSKLRLNRQFFIFVKKCISQENIKISHLNYKQALNNIKKICNDQLLKNIIDNYPVYKLGYKQKIFIFMVKYRLVLLLYILLCR